MTGQREALGCPCGAAFTTEWAHADHVKTCPAWGDFWEAEVRTLVAARGLEPCS